MKLKHKAKETVAQKHGYYKLTITFDMSHGDYETEFIAEENNKKQVGHLKKFISVLNKVMEMNRTGGLNCPYSNIIKFVDKADKKDKEFMNILKNRDYIAWDEHYQCDGSLDSFSVAYFDKKGKEHAVSWEE
jgi:hypothetical protein